MLARINDELSIDEDQLSISIASWPDERTTLPPLEPEETNRINIVINIEKMRRVFRNDIE